MSLFTLCWMILLQFCGVFMRKCISIKKVMLVTETQAYAQIVGSSSLSCVAYSFLHLVLGLSILVTLCLS